MADSKNIQQKPCTLLPDYELTTCDLNSHDTLEEVCQFLNVHYSAVEGKSIEANFTMEFIRWALCPPEYHKSWHVGARDKKSKELIAFIGGVPVLMRAMGSDVPTAIINVLCVHTDLRSRKLASVMIAEMTKRVSLERVGQGMYAVSSKLHTPGVPTCSYTTMMRNLNPETLVDVGLPDAEFKNMERSDINGVKDLLNYINSDKKIGVSWNDDTIEHLLLPKEDLIHSYVVRDPHTSDITDFCSFYIFPLTMVENGEKATVKCASSFYIGAKATKLTQLMNDMLIMAKEKGVDVFYALDMGEDENFWKELKFVEGIKLNYYIQDANGIANSPMMPSEIGIVLW